MSNFLYLFRGGHEKFKSLSPEEREAHMQEWGVYMGSLKERGQLIDGLPLSDDGKFVENKGEIITNGPFAEGAEVVGGYLIVSADNIDHAVEISKQCPIFEYGGNIEVREIMSIDM